MEKKFHICIYNSSLQKQIDSLQLLVPRFWEDTLNLIKISASKHLSRSSDELISISLADTLKKFHRYFEFFQQWKESQAWNFFYISSGAKCSGVAKFLPHIIWFNLRVKFIIASQNLLVRVQAECKGFTKISPNNHQQRFLNFLPNFFHVSSQIKLWDSATIHQIRRSSDFFQFSHISSYTLPSWF